PEKGLVGLAAKVAQMGNEKDYRTLWPAGGSQAVVLHGRNSNFCFAQDEPSLRDYTVQDYVHHVSETFDADWCLARDVRYLYLSHWGLLFNPGLARAIKQGKLRPVARRGESGVYEVVAGGSD